MRWQKRHVSERLRECAVDLRGMNVNIPSIIIVIVGKEREGRVCWKAVHPRWRLGSSRPSSQKHRKEGAVGVVLGSRVEEKV